MSLLRRAVLAALTAASFAVTAALLVQVAPYPEMGGLDDKLRFFAARRDDYDVLFFGSSRVLRGVVPEVFDAEMAERGVPVRSFNFGIDGMGGHETAALVRRVLALRPRRLRWVVVELDGWSAELRPENRFKRRVVFWHDPAETLSALETVARSEPSRSRRLELSAAHLLHMAARGTGAGRGRDLVWRLRERIVREGRAAAGGTAAELARSGGFEPFSQSAYGTPTSHPFRRRFLELLPAYRLAVARLPGANRAEEGLGAYNVRAVARQVAAIRRAGAEPVHLITPTARPTPELYRLAEAGAVPCLLAFNDPVTYPGLFVEDHRFDAEHLTTEGARRFSRRLAERFVRAAAAPHRGEPRLAIVGLRGR
ncbi:MAG TPA: hypothetical protein VJG13_02770 [Thermoanaerobaculia bacterium]|nr:hypothetical protein [Thermoanaerobaculia bacterium]